MCHLAAQPPNETASGEQKLEDQHDIGNMTIFLIKAAVGRISLTADRCFVCKYSEKQSQ